ncbi:MAG: hypothetical protein JW725_03330 [Candidatus Babeliaceae bacterium]|nr:hypothetical protein [Candidatus Babeliaceae bacterium]
MKKNFILAVIFSTISVTATVVHGAPAGWLPLIPAVMKIPATFIPLEYYPASPHYRIDKNVSVRFDLWSMLDIEETLLGSPIRGSIQDGKKYIVINPFSIHYFSILNIAQEQPLEELDKDKYYFHILRAIKQLNYRKHSALETAKKAQAIVNLALLMGALSLINSQIKNNLVAFICSAATAKCISSLTQALMLSEYTHDLEKIGDEGAFNNTVKITEIVGELANKVANFVNSNQSNDTPTKITDAGKKYLKKLDLILTCCGGFCGESVKKFLDPSRPTPQERLAAAGI